MQSWFGGLSKVPSAAFALTYILLIPLFALIYSYLPGHFYHTTIQYEKSLQQDKQRAYQQLRRDVLGLWLKSQNRHHLIHSGAPKEGEENIDLNTLTISDFRVTSDEYPMRVQAKVSLCLDAEPHSSNPHESLPSKACQPTRIYCYPRDESDPETRFNCNIDVFRNPQDVFTVKDGPWAQIFASSDTSATIKAIIDAQKGFPSRVSGHFIRMLYLSATTITTLGFGDIVPITATARLLVAIEAILGIILIGLFLNSLFAEKLRPSDVKEQKSN